MWHNVKKKRSTIDGNSGDSWMWIKIGFFFFYFICLLAIIIFSPLTLYGNNLKAYFHLYVFILYYKLETTHGNILKCVGVKTFPQHWFSDYVEFVGAIIYPINYK